MNKQKTKKMVIIISLVLSIILYTMLINPKEEIPINNEDDNFNTDVLVISHISGSIPTTFLKFFYQKKDLNDAKKYGYYLVNANRKKSNSSYKCTTDKTSTSYKKPCYYYICDSNYLDYSPVSSKPSKNGGKWMCAFIKYPRNYI